MSRTRLLAGLALLLLVVGVVPVPRAALAAPADPGAFMSDLGNQILGLITNKQLSADQRRAQFKTLAESAFDVPKIAQFVLGRYWRTATDQEKTQFTQAFEDYMVNVYWSRFTSYNGETFKVASTQDEGNGTTLVTTDIMRPTSGQPPVKVSWDIVKIGGQYKIRDASLEGVSQAITYRDEFSSIIERNGGSVAGLITQLKQRTAG
ncbi:MAG TPA: ABC transporter substrate-binding protein [Stellaceae bacterium]|nr:ABC transporter substrate-binding protein [Stellaceae bacterium]